MSWMIRFAEYILERKIIQSLWGWLDVRHVPLFNTLWILTTRMHFYKFRKKSMVNHLQKNGPNIDPSWHVCYFSFHCLRTSEQGVDVFYYLWSRSPWEQHVPCLPPLALYSDPTGHTWPSRISLLPGPMRTRTRTMTTHTLHAQSYCSPGVSWSHHILSSYGVWQALRAGHRKNDNGKTVI